MGIQIGAKPDRGFDDPIGMLADCHRRIEWFLNILRMVAERARGRSLSAQETEAVDSALHYFHVGGLRHNADEEQSLFPRLRHASATDALAELQALENDHRRAGELHVAIEQGYRLWMDTGRLNAEDEQRLIEAAAALGRLYAQHIRIEEETVFPRAARTLDKQTIAAMGEEFRARRA